MTLTVQQLPMHSHTAIFTPGGEDASVSLQASTKVATKAQAADGDYIASNNPLGGAPKFIGADDAEPTVALGGISGGGGFVPQAAMHDPRIKAIAMSSAVVDAYPLFAAMPVTRATPKAIASWSSFHANIVKVINWRWGVPMDKPSALVEANRGFTFDPAKITVPALLVVGEGEYKSAETQRQQQLCMAKLPNPMKKLVVTPSDEGASNHCIMENRSIVGEVVFDWLDEVLKRR